MKNIKLLTFLLLNCFTLSIYSQYTYIPLVEEDANWLMVYGDNDFTEFTYFIFRIEGDSTVNGVDYKKVYRFDNPDLSGALNLESGYFYSLLREDIVNKKIYQGPSDYIETYNLMLCVIPNSERLLYDFSHTVGDFIENCDGESSAEITQDIIASRYGRDRRIIHPGSPSFGIIEGIGYAKGLFNVGLKNAAKGNSLLDHCIGNLTDCFNDYYTNNTGYFTEGNKQWNQFSTDFMGKNYPVKYRLSEKLEFRDGFYKRLLKSEDESSTNFTPTDLSIRETENVIYLKDSYLERVLYDFNLEVGDTLSTIDLSFNEIKYVTVQVDSFDLLGERRKAIIVRCAGDEDGTLYGYATWVEGVGDVNRGILAPLDGCRTDGNTTLLCYFENDEIKYSNPNYNACWTTTRDISIVNDLVVYPNPVTNHLYVKSSLDYMDYRIVDQMGKVVSTGHMNSSNYLDVSTLTSGIYFVQLDHKDYVSQSRFIKF